MKVMLQRSARRWLAAALAAVLLVPTIPFCVQMASTLWPGLHYDSVLYSTVAVNQSAGISYKFEAYTPALVRSPDGKIGHHGLLSYPLYALAMADSNYKEYFRVLSLITILSVWLFAFLLYLETRRHGFWSIFVPAAGGWLLLAVLVQIQGRPEHLIPMAVIICELAIRVGRMGTLPAGVLRGLCCGVIAAISPAPALLYATGLGMYYFAVLPWADFFRIGAVTVATSALLWTGLTIFLFGNSPLEALMGAAGSDDSYQARSRVLFQWLFNPNTPLIGLLYAQAGALLILGVLRKVAHDNLRALAAAVGTVLLVALVAAVYVTGIKNPMANYRALPFLPLWLLFLVSVVLVGASPVTSAAKWWQQLNRAAFALFLLAATVGSGRFLWDRYREAARESSAFAHAKEAYEEIKGKLGPDQRIAIDQFGSASDIVLDGHPWRMLSIVPEDPNMERQLIEAEKTLGLEVAYLVRSPRMMHPPRAKIGPFVLTGQSFPKESKKPATYGFYIYERAK